MRANRWKRATLVALVTIAAAIGSARAQTTSGDDYASERAKAVELAKQHSWLDALPLFEDLAKKNPKDAFVLEGLAQSLLAHSMTLQDQDEAGKERIRAKALLEAAQQLGDHSQLAEKLLDTLKGLPKNGEYYLLAYIIQSVSGKTYADFLAQEVFKPLGMSSSGFASTLAIVPQMAEGYTRFGGSLRGRDYFDRSLEIGAGGVYSTTPDLLRGNEALSENKLLNQKSSDLMFSPSSPGNYGFGWFIEKTPRNKAYHEGLDPGFSAFEIRYPEERTVVIVLSNLENAPVRLIANELSDLLISGRTPKNQN